MTAKLCDLATLLIGVIPTLWRRRSAGFHVRDRSLVTFCRSVTGCYPRGRRPEGAFRNSDSPRNTSFVKSRRAACRLIALNLAEGPQMANLHSFAVTGPNWRVRQNERRAEGEGLTMRSWRKSSGLGRVPRAEHLAAAVPAGGRRTQSRTRRQSRTQSRTRPPDAIVH